MEKKRFYELDLLRFVAAAAVLLYHYTFRAHAADNLSPFSYDALVPVTKYGFLGVQLFFLISGFVILMTASNGSKRGFVISRLVRLYPAFWLSCTLTFVASLLSAKARHVSLHDYLLNMTMLSGYFDVPSVDSVYWSLFIEMRFYALVFLVLVFRQIHRANVILGGWLAVYLLTTVKHIKVIPFLVIPEFAPYFIAGSTFYLVATEGLSLYKGVLLAVCFAVIGRETTSHLSEMDAHFHTTFSAPVVWAVMGLFFMTFFAVCTGRTSSIASRKWTALGALTYPLYLLHQNLGYEIFNVGYPTVSKHLLLWGAAALMIALAYLVHRFERLTAPPLKSLLLRVIPGGPSAERPR